MDATIYNDKNPAESSILRLKQKYYAKSREAVKRRSYKRGHDHSFSSQSYINIIEDYKRKNEDLLLNNADLAKSLEIAHLEISKLEQELENLQRELSFKSAVQSKLSKVSGNLNIIASLISDTVTSIMDSKKLMCFSSDNFDPDSVRGENSSKLSFEIPQLLTNNIVEGYNSMENANSDNQQNLWKPPRPAVTLDMSTIAEETTRNLSQFLQTSSLINSDSPMGNSITTEEVNSVDKPCVDNRKEVNLTDKLCVDNTEEEKPLNEKNSTPQNKELETSRETPKTPVLSSNPQFLPSLIPKPVRPLLLRKQKFLGRNENSHFNSEETVVSETKASNEKETDKNIGIREPVTNKTTTKPGCSADVSQKIVNTDNVANTIGPNNDKHHKILDVLKGSNNDDNVKKSTGILQQKSDGNSLLNGSSPEFSNPLISRKTFFIPNKSPIPVNRKTFVISKDPVKRLDSISESDDVDSPMKETPKELLSRDLPQSNLLVLSNLNKDNDNSGELTQLLRSSEIVSDNIDTKKSSCTTIVLSHPINRIEELEEFEESSNDVAIFQIEENSKSIEQKTVPSPFKVEKQLPDVTILHEMDMELTESLSSTLINRLMLGNNLLPTSSSNTNVSNANGQEIQKDNANIEIVETEVNKDAQITVLKPLTLTTNENDLKSPLGGNKSEKIALPDSVKKSSALKQRPQRKIKKNCKYLYSPEVTDDESKSPNEGTKKGKRKSKNPTGKSKKQPGTKPNARGKNKKTSTKEQLPDEDMETPMNFIANEGKVSLGKRKANIYDVFIEENQKISPYKSKKMEQISENENKRNISCDLFGDDNLPAESIHSLRTDIQSSIEAPQVVASATKKSPKEGTKIKKKKNVSKVNVPNTEKENEQSFSDFTLGPPKNNIFAMEPKKRGRPKKPLNSHIVNNDEASTDKKSEKDGNYYNAVDPVVHLQNLLSPLSEHFKKNCGRNSFELQGENMVKVTSPTGQSLELVLPGIRENLSTNVKTPRSPRGSTFYRKNSTSVEKSHINSSSISDSGYSRRNKQVSYREPSLHSKLRRP